ncbi:response regulator transcription factor [Parasphaerochaeta coccoides]|uniref:Two component transcriptional regulator, AraC family n=1 Tax=Parasphaerochaeta coccoides (strain ATCC BAA-1237 / DSM 17374 / SPN1) TaxID=760011 RepID=F4GHJ6_PARC1|nr:response regulator [Parasphaerochaeta coccoides]AEC02585.1 two component transcriptional regulator, AraC family [Parasphaerochaeta coccoides DSM 17374]
MYKVVLVDDEAIILSGIRFLMDWQSHDCQVIGTARNGKAALDMIRKEVPDIVLCDISMPIMDGIELLRTVTVELPQVVFIMLTCLEEFRYVQKSLHHNAFDYLLKTEMDAAALAMCIERAKPECEARRKLLRMDAADLHSLDEQGHVQDILVRLTLPEPLESRYRTLLAEKGMLRNHAFICVQLQYPDISPETGFSAADYQRMYDYQGEITRKVIGNSFSHFMPICGVRPFYHSFQFLVWDVPLSSFSSRVAACTVKLKNASTKITGITTHVLATGVQDSPDGLEDARDELRRLDKLFFIRETDLSQKDCKEDVVYSRQPLYSLTERIAAALDAKNSSDVRLYLSKARERIATETYQRHQVAWLCEEIASHAMVSLKTEYSSALVYPFHQDVLPYLGTRSAFLRWLQVFEEDAVCYLSHYGTVQDSVIERAKQYVHSHIHSRIMLDEVASTIGVSAGYLSSVFSRQCEMSFIEYVNTAKTDEAIRMMKGGENRINEIFAALGFENSYYFSKVFKRHVGMSPSVYISRIQQEQEKTE